MMDKAYFVGRKELIDWLNEFLALDYNKVEQCSTGAAPCQIWEAVHPGYVAMSKVKYDAKLEYEFIDNFKQLQAGMDKANADKKVDVERLIKGKYQDNLEFLQWLKAYFDKNYVPAEGGYDAVGRRSKSRGAPGALKSSGAPASGMVAPKKSISATKPAATTTPAATTATAKAAPGTPASSGAAKTAATPGKAPTIDDLNAQIQQLTASVDAIEKERDFYYGKLRQVEIYAQEHESDPSCQEVIAILYATDDAPAS